MSVFKSPEETSRIANVEAGFADILCHHGAGANHRAVTDVYRHNRSISSYAHAVTNGCGAPELRFAGRTASGKWIVNEHGTVRDETIVADSHQLADKCMRLDPASLTDLYTFLDLDKRADEALVANLTAIKVYRLDNSDVFAKPDIDNAHMAKVGVIQCICGHRLRI